MLYLKPGKLLKIGFLNILLKMLTLKQKIGGILSIIPLTVALILICRDCIKRTELTSYKLNSFNYLLKDYNTP